MAGFLLIDEPIGSPFIDAGHLLVA